MPPYAGALVAASLLLFFFAGAATLEARPRAMRFEQLSNEDGLSQSIVNCILQDRTGFLWLGTQNGLNRHDGYGFKVYRRDAEEPSSLGHDFIMALSEDPTGDLWIGTEGGGLARWRRATDSFQNHRHDPQDPHSLSGDRVVDLERDRTGVLWIATLDAGLNRLEEAAKDGSVSFRHYRHDPADPDSLAHDQLGAVYEDSLGQLWVGTWGGLDLLDARQSRFTHYRHDPQDPHSLADDRVRAIVEDDRGALWVGTLGGLHRFDRQSGRFERFLHDPADPTSLSHDWVRALFEDAAGRLWIGTDGGLNLWQEESASFAGYHPDPADPKSLGSDQVLALYQDRGGVLWISTIGTGVSKWNPGTWSFPHYWSDDDDGASNMVLAISEDSAGSLWVGTFGGGLDWIERGVGPEPRTRYRHDPRDPDSLGDDRVTTLLHDREGALWVGTIGSGLNRLTAGSRSFERYRHDPSRPRSLSADAVTTLHQDGSGRLWVGTYGAGLNLHLGDGAFRRFSHDPDDPQSLSHDRPVSISEDSSGQLWVATDGGGLNRFLTVTEAFLRIEHDPADPHSLASNELSVVHVDAADRLWVGTKGHGLDRLERLELATGQAVFHNTSRAEGLPDDAVWGLQSDASGWLWIATDNGLSKLDPETGGIVTYTASHGLQSNEFNHGAHYRSPSGELFFGGVNGFNAFFPERIEANQHVPPVVLTGFTRLGQPVRFEQPVFDVSRVSLGYRDHSFTFEFAALDFTVPNENRYRYRLEGFHDNWIDNDTRRWVSFTNLDPGRYLLRVQGSNSDGVWNQQGAQIAIDVAPPPWRTWWANALYALGLAAAILGVSSFYRQRRRAERERELAERDRERAERDRAIAERDRQRVAERERLIEERERMAERQEELLAELGRKNAQLGRKNAELERFNYTVTHDLKSPLVTIKGFLGMLQHDIGRDDSKRVEHDIGRITAAADKMQALLEELLDLSRVSDPRRLARKEVALNDLVGESLDLVEGLYAERGVEIEVDPRLPVVMADPVRLLQVYQNLLTNAVKHMGDQPSPRVEIGVRPGEPSDREHSRAANIFFVRDNGSGVDPRYHHQIFELFERLDATRGGSGVGLAVVKRIIELHGGRVWVESKGEGHGSTFCFILGDVAPEDGGKAGVAREKADRHRADGGVRRLID